MNLKDPKFTVLQFMKNNMRRYLIILIIFLSACKITIKHNTDFKDSPKSFAKCPSCNEEKGRVEDYSYPPMELPWTKTKVYLPPCYDDNTQCSYPVLYLMHGAGGNPINWINMGIVQIMDRLIETKKIEPFIVVMMAIPKVNINGALYEGWDNKREWFTKDLIPGIDKTYRTKKNRLYRGAGGVSQGGGNSGLFGWKHPEIIGAIGLFGATQPAGGFMPGWKRRSPELSALLDKVPVNLTPHVYIDVGIEDGLWVENLTLTLHLRDRLMPYIFYIEEGNHAGQYWGGHLEEYLCWFNCVFGKPATHMQKENPIKQIAKKNHKINKNSKGTEVSIKINNSEINNKNLPTAEIYLPSCYYEHKKEFYPVLYLLNEEGNEPEQWFEMEISEKMDKLIYEKIIPPFIIAALPIENLQNESDIKTAIQTIEKQFRIIKDRAWRGIAGVSMGGTLAINIGHTYPNLFGFIGGFSAKSLDDINKLEKIIKATPAYLRPQVFLDIGNNDPLRSSQDLLHHLYTINNWYHTSTISKGMHDSSYWKERLEYYLVWFGNSFGNVAAKK